MFWYQDKSLLSTLRQKAEEAHVSSGKGFKPVPGDILIYPTGTTITHQIITQARRNTVVKKEKECVHVAIVDTNGRVNEMVGAGFVRREFDLDGDAPCIIVYRQPNQEIAQSAAAFAAKIQAARYNLRGTAYAATDLYLRGAISEPDASQFKEVSGVLTELRSGSGLPKAFRRMYCSQFVVLMFALADVDIRKEEGITQEGWSLNLNLRNVTPAELVARMKEDMACWKQVGFVYKKDDKFFSLPVDGVPSEKESFEEGWAYCI